MSSSPLTKVPCSALSPVSALSVRKQEIEIIPQSLSKQAIELQITLNKLKEAQQKKKKLSNSNIIITSISIQCSKLDNPVSSPQKNKRTEESEQHQIQYKSLFKDIDTPANQNEANSKPYSKMNKQDAEQKFEERKQQIKQQVDQIKQKNKLKQPKRNAKKKEKKPITKIDFSKSSIIRQKVESNHKSSPQQPQQQDVLHLQLKQMQKQLKADIAKLDNEIQGGYQISAPFEMKNKGHDLYQQGLLMEDRKQFKKKIHEREKKLKEMEECTFKPQISQPKINNDSHQQYSRQQNNSKPQECKSHRDKPIIQKQLSRSHSQDLINSTTTTLILQNDINCKLFFNIKEYLNKVQDKYQAIMTKANSIKQKVF